MKKCAIIGALALVGMAIVGCEDKKTTTTTTKPAGAATPSTTTTTTTTPATKPAGG